MSLESLPFGAPSADVARFVHRDGAVINPGFLMPEDAHPFSVPLELARSMSPALQQITGFRSFHQFRQHGGSLWQYDFEELADHLKL